MIYYQWYGLLGKLYTFYCNQKLNAYVYIYIYYNNPQYYILRGTEPNTDNLGMSETINPTKNV